jgi:hypothetical protein
MRRAILFSLSPSGISLGPVHEKSGAVPEEFGATGALRLSKGELSQIGISGSRAIESG